jgi:LCP family protein required for cell wall assembly
MGTKRLSDQDERPRATGPLKPGTGKLKGKTGPLKGTTGRLKPGTGPMRSKYTTAQLRMPPSKRRKKHRSPLMKLVAATLMLTGVLGVAAAGAVAYGAYTFLESLSPGAAQKPAAIGEVLQGLIPLTERRNVLLLGADYSYASGKRIAAGPARSDTIIVMGVDPGAKRISMISIPRDTRALVRGRYDKINSAMALGGPALTAKVVSELLGVPINDYVMVNTEGLERLVDVMGGVPIFVEKDMAYDDNTAKLHIHLEKGWKTLSGDEAHQYVRFRHDELGDIGRVQRQQQFMRAAAQQLLSPATITRVPQMLNTVRENVSTNLGGAEMMQLATFGAMLKRDQVKMVMLPGEFSAGRFAASYWLADPRQAQDLGRRLLAGASAGSTGEAAKTGVKLTVLNGTMRAGLASAAARSLRADGWNVWAVGDAAQRDLGRTRIIAQTGHDEWNGQLAKSLGVSPEKVDASVGDLTTDFTIIVGEDFAQGKASQHATR